VPAAAEVRPPGAGGGPARGLRHNRNWRRLWLAQAVSLTGDSFFNLTVLLWVVTVVARGRPWAPDAASGVLIAASVPVLVVGPVAGVWIDRWDRRRIMMMADVGRAVLVSALLIVPALGDLIPSAARLAFIYAVVAGESGFSQFFNPSRLAILGRILHPVDRAEASGMLQATSGTAAIIGPPLAALLFALGVQWALVIDAASFVISFAAIRSIRPPLPAAAAGPARLGFGAEFLAGIRFFAGSRLLVALCAGVVICTLGTGAVNTLQVFFLRDDLHAATAWLGTLYAAVGVGAVAGAMLGGRIASRVGAARVFRLAMVAGGVLLIVYSRLTMLAPAVAVAGLTGLMFGAINAAAPPLFLAAIPQHLMGRVMSVFNPVQQVANLASIACAGAIAGSLAADARTTVAGLTLGPVSAIFGVSGLLVAAAGLALTRLLREPAGEPAAAAA
jgi:MFS family permease